MLHAESAELVACLEPAKSTLCFEEEVLMSAHFRSASAILMMSSTSSSSVMCASRSRKGAEPRSSRNASEEGGREEDTATRVCLHGGMCEGGREVTRRLKGMASLQG